MLRFAIVAFVAALSAVGVAQAFASLDLAYRAPQPQAAVAIAPQRIETPAGAAQVSKSPDGHYWAEGEVDGHTVKFLVDTGASAVALTAEDARRLGIDTQGLNYNYTVTTANGQARAAQVKLASVAVGQARIDNVDAFVLDRGLETSLLGMSYLGRLSQFEATQTSLILRP
ncbi:TIGR02281 family clan AA aspartic protease [Caulobacter sp. KR2-114]|uniref:TIGR02281 family clan AA aspartic protease n=1 Tax=Caulobacter sp. KR2-114 TaxID=3400912 RepID=UPI003BFA9385